MPVPDFKTFNGALGKVTPIPTLPAESMRINNIGNVGIGTTTPATKLQVNGDLLASSATAKFITRVGGVAVTPDYQFFGNAATSGMLIGRFTANAAAPRLYFAKSRNATPGSHTVVASGDQLGAISFGGSDGTNIVEAARISVEVDNPPGTNDMPGRMTFFTTADGTSSILERMRLNNSGELLIGYTTSNSTSSSFKLQVNSQIFATSGTIATSDGNYKENIEQLTDALNIVNSLNPISFNWKPHPTHNFDLKNKTVGFIAQEVQEVLKDKPYVNSIVKQNQTIYSNENGEEVVEPF